TLRFTSTAEAGSPCEEAFEEIEIEIFEEITADAGSDLAVCGDESIILTGTVTGLLQSASWSIPTTAGTLTDQNYNDETGEVRATFTPNPDQAGNQFTAELVATPIDDNPCNGQNSTITIDLLVLPTINTIVNPNVREDIAGEGTAEVDLTELENAINPSLTANFQWFEDGENEGLIDDPNNFIVEDDQEVFFTITEENGCTNSGSIIYEVTSIPETIDPEPFFCEDVPAGSNQASNIDLTALNADVNNSGGLNFEWYTDEEATDLISTPTNFNFSGSPFTVFVKVIDENNAAAFAIQVVTLNLLELPNYSQTKEFAICEDLDEPGQVSLVIEDIQSEIFENDADFSFEWYFEEDGISATPLDPASSITRNTDNSAFIVLVIQEYPDQSLSCVLEVVVDINFLPLPEINDISPEVCEDTEGSSMAFVNLTGLINAINDGEDLEFTWFTDVEFNAEIDEPDNFEVENGDEIFFIITDTSNPENCQNFGSFVYEVKSLPIVSEISPIELCPGEILNSFDFSSDNFDAENFEFEILSGNENLIDLSAGIEVSNSFPEITAGENLTEDPITIEIAVRQRINECLGNDQIFTITIKPEPVLIEQEDIVLCSEDDFDIAFTTEEISGTPIISWTQIDGDDIGLGSTDASGTGNLVGTAITNTTTEAINATFEVVVSLDGCESEAKTFTITVNSQPVVEDPETIEVCAGDEVEVSFSSQLGGSSDVEYSWSIEDPTLGMPESGKGDINFVSQQFFGSTDEVRTVTVRGTSAEGCEGEAITFDLRIKPLPAIEQQVDLFFAPGQEVDAIAFMDNSGGDSEFSWTVTNGEAIGINDEEGTGSLPAFTAAANDTGEAIVAEVSVSALWEGCSSVDDMKFTIALLPTPIITEIENLSFCPEDDITIDFTVNLSDATVNWTSSNSDIGIENGSGQINFTAPANTTSDPIISTITASATRESNGVSITGPEITFELRILPQPVVSEQGDISLCPGEEQESIVFTSVNLANTGFSWEVSDPSLLIDVDAEGSGNLPSFTAAPNFSGDELSTTVTVIQTVDGCESEPMVFEITIRPEPVMEEPANIIVCSGEPFNTNFATETITDNPSFTWRQTGGNDIGLGSTDASDTGNLVGTAITNTTTAAISATFEVVASLDGCESEPKTFTITVNPQPVVEDPETIEVCAGDEVEVIFSSQLGGSIDVEYSWSIENPILGMPESGTGDINFVSQQLFGSTDVVRTVTVRGTSAEGCEGEEITFDLRIKPIPQINNPDEDLEQRICSGDDISLIFSSTFDEQNFSWSTTVSGNVSGVPSSGTGNFDGPIINLGNTQATVTFSVVATGAGTNTCSSPVQDFTVEVDPRPDLNTLPSRVEICNGDDFILDLSSPIGIAGTLIGWTVSDNDLGATDGSGTQINALLDNQTNSPLSVVYSIQAVAGDCASEVRDVEVVVFPRAEVDLEDDFTICEGIEINLIATLSGAATSGSWSGGSGQIIGANSREAVYQPAESEIGSSVTFTFTTNNPVGACGSVSDNITITIDPRPQVGIDTEGLISQICTETDRFELIGVPAGGSFQIENTVSGGNFVVAEAGRFFFDTDNTGTGTFDVIYRFSDAVTGCEGVSSRRVTVSDGLDPEFEFLFQASGAEASEDVSAICQDIDGVVRLDPTSRGGVFSGAGVIIIGREARFDPSDPEVKLDTLNPITYQITSSAGCTNEITKNIFVSSSPRFGINAEKVCGVTNEVAFSLNSLVLNDGDSIIAYAWNFGNATSSLAEPIHQFPSPGLYEVSVSVQTLQTCTVREVKGNIIVSDLSIDQITASNICGDGDTQFEVIPQASFIPSDLGANFSYQWNFNDNSGSSADVNNQTAFHNFSGFGEYTVNVTVTDDNTGCSITDSIVVNIVPSISSFPFNEVFDLGTNSGWFVEGDEDVWELGLPSANTINESAVAGTQVWATNLDGVYSKSRRAQLITPCFEISNLSQPMLSFFLNRDLEVRDGLAVEYSTNGGISWNVLGGLDRGLSWYNFLGIPSDPTNSGVENLGWSGRSEGWEEVAFPLDDILAASGELGTSVIFRFSFASENSNIPNNDFDGVAIDDFYVGERDKRVLLENFTNINLPEFGTNSAAFQASVSSILADDVTSIQYHTAFPISDPINQENPRVANARALFYGIETAPQFIIDGKLYDELDQNVIERQSLKKPNALIDIDLREDGSLDGRISGIVNIQPLSQLRSEHLLYISIVEQSREVNNITLHDLILQNLPNSAGTLITDIDTSEDLSFDFEYIADRDFPAGDITIVAFLQNNETKEVVQSARFTIDNFVEQGVVNSLNDLGKMDIRLYPNPATKYVGLNFAQALSSSLDYELVHLNGTVLKKGTIRAGQNKEQIDVEGLRSGMYMIRLSADEQPSRIMKVIIDRR
ncbi:MAG: T9SS type A sorting domain-containing protein, partial [Cyclobacteriaceae bacterium]|nr:T9SS type A sorting domain-containing protein [Cyclobacteriaceae bacterium]